MKKISLIFLILILFLTGCAIDPLTYHFDADEIISGAKKIELVECKNDNPTEVIVDENTVLNFDVDEFVVVEELEKSEIEDFAYDLSSIRFHIENESVESPVGYAVLIYMENEEIIVISCTHINDKAYSMVASFTTEGEFVRHIARFADAPAYRKLLEKYFQV